MRRCILIITVFVAALLQPYFGGRARATVTFDFYETGITACGTAICVQPPQPTVLMRLTLSSPTETGSAEYVFPSSPPVVTDVNFAFHLNGFGEPVISAPNFGSTPVGFVLGYDITWGDMGGELTAVSVNYLSTNDQVAFSAGSFGLTGGGIGSDAGIDGCSMGTCTVAGYWQREVPEPASAALFGCALVGLAFLGRRRRDI